ncbi:hypothetical protein [Paraburkholderia sp.]|uniref:hypothetical protein n=1 Tax=Paraburkholderia sp. TaxID=1926495 RepID=UPI0039E5EE14
MKLYVTHDIAASIRKAYADFTHVLVNRGYTTIKPVFFRSGKIADLPVYQWASWDKSTDAQLKRWRESGGVLLDRYTFSDRAGTADVLVFVECPLTMKRIVQSAINTAEYTVLPVPHTWAIHRECIDLRTPPPETLQKLWNICRGARLTDIELADISGIPRQQVMYMRKSLKPVEEWQIKPRLAPEFAGFLDAWEWVDGGRIAGKKDVRTAGHRSAIKEMARLGHIVLEKYQQYPDKEPDWAVLERKRSRAIADLAEVQLLVESLPDHLQT